MLVERMLCELYMIYAWLEDSGFDSNQFVVVTAAFQQIKYFLTEVGPLATISAVEAWRQTHGWGKACGNASLSLNARFWSRRFWTSM
jgi:hypothetical protein